MNKNVLIGTILLITSILAFSIKYIMYTPSEEVITLSEKVNKMHKLAKQEIEKQKREYSSTKLKKTYADYIKNKNFDTVFLKANELVDKTTLIIKKANKMLKDFNKDKESEIIKLYKEAEINLKKAINSAKKPIEFLKALNKTMKEKDKILTDTDFSFKSVEADFNKFKIDVNKKITAYPNKKEDLTKKLKEVTVLFNKLKKEHDTIMSEGTKKEMNVEVVMNEYKELKEDKEKIKTLLSKYTKMLVQLDRDYTKILIDMKAKPYIIIGRTSWDEFYDYPTEHTYIYPKKYLTKNQFDHFAKNGNETIAILEGAFFGKTLLTAQNGYSNVYVKDVIRNPKKEWPSGDNAAEYWISDLGVDYFHKYKIIENGKVRITDWVPVDEDTYMENLSNLGMAIVSKPKGYYDSEKKVIPEPPGMAYVGNKNYGEWKTDSSGNSFWHYYGMYSFFSNMLGGNRYSRHDYDTYRRYERERKPYYGKGVYGTNGSYTRSKYENSTFTSSGGLKKTYKTGSYRNVGSRVRGRGPGGGGK